MSLYAKNTLVSVDRSKGEIEHTLTKYGAAEFMYGWKQDMAVLGFRMNNRFIRFHLPMPDKNSDRYRYKMWGQKKTSVELTNVQALKLYEQDQRQAWRALALVVKAKLEAVESGITTFEEEFLAHIILPNQKTVGEIMVPQIESAYKSKKMPPLLGYEP